jgi:hypothetical protein
MTATHIIAVGRMSNGYADIRVAPTATLTAALQHLNRATERTYTIRQNGDAYTLVSPIGDYPARDAHALVRTMMSMTHAAQGRTSGKEAPLDGTLQRLADYGEAVAAEEDAMIDALFAPVDEDDAPLLPADLIDYDAEADDLEDDMLDREYHARGMW